MLPAECRDKRIINNEPMNNITEKGIIPVFNHPDAEICKHVLKACFDGGLEVFEFTNRSKNAYDVFVQLKKFSETNYPEMSLGVGSIMDAELTNRYIDAGADFIVSPVIVEDMAEVCNKHNILWIPGCATPTEMVFATRLGAKLVKMFPAEQIGGPDFVKAVLAPLPWLKIVPTGGVDTSEENLRQWFEAGVVCVGIGSKLFTKQIIDNKDYSKLTDDIKKTIEIIENIRHKTQDTSIKTNKS
jgi:2-dehydro-3-deoxyphosphogluconate aldolase / (4S)-4-hydroxy-2-oxoglutarate aldolase